MKVRKKKKEAERGEGEASAIMVSQGALSCTLPDRRCFLGQGPASASRQGFTLVDTFKKKNTGIERGQGGREAAEGIYRVSFLQRERQGDAQRLGCSSLEVQVGSLLSAPPAHTLLLFLPPTVPPCDVQGIDQTAEGTAVSAPSTAWICWCALIFFFFFFLLLSVTWDDGTLLFSSEWDGCLWG